jgi:hypothetical protein
MNNWLSLIIALPTANASERMRAWRALKACGAAVLRDGVYLLPDTAACRQTLEAIERDIVSSNGTAYLLPINDPAGERFVRLFDRSDEYGKLCDEIVLCHGHLSAANVQASAKQARKLRKAFAQLGVIDFFPGAEHASIDSALKALEVGISRALSSDEPDSNSQPIERLSLDAYQGRVWATRKRPWVDRLASAWFIQRFIDSTATLVWLDLPSDCPVGAVGFDFDGATFSHTGNLVTFETLQASFALAEPGLSRIAAIVHYLDVGGSQPAEASGIERVLAGLRETIQDDDLLLSASSAIFDGLLASFKNEESAQ